MMNKKCKLTFGLLILFSNAFSQSYLSKSNSESRYQEIELVNETMKTELRQLGHTLDPLYFTYEFSNMSGTPLVVVYVQEGKPCLLHDWKDNDMYFLGYCRMGIDTVLFYTNSHDFYPNGIAEDYVCDIGICKDSTFNKYYYPNRWFQSGIDDPFHKTFKIKRNGHLTKVDNKKAMKLSKWYLRTCRKSMLPPPPPPRL